uniref:DDE Tnp4 domain-containing protein n=1 Tax=Salvator merianae TaxID=96440 RepID=A0A8D0E558_SALMN
MLSHLPSIHRRIWVFPRTTDWWENFVMGIWGDEEWICHFRMTRSTFEFLVEQLTATLQRSSTQMREPIPVRKRLAVAIWWMATNCCYRVVGQQFGIGRSTASAIVREVAAAMENPVFCSQLMDPSSAHGFPFCIGAVDGPHIRILAPVRQAAEFINRKSFFSVVLMGTVSRDGAIFPGAILWNVGGVEVPPLILGDAAFPMRRWLMKPYGGNLNWIQAHFNHCLARARNVVERTFGRLKQRWRCLQGTLQVSEENLNPIIASCVVLHNVCEARKPESFREDNYRTVHLPEETWVEAEVERIRGAQDKEVWDAVAKFLWENRHHRPQL